ncbi:MAG TPA: hypothetical protein VD791_09495 [Burkholderiales bacterium]|nr:hypothetical protein [Burkholderiales bacterium]
MSAIVERRPLPVGRLNRKCFCIGADLDGLRAWLHRDLARRGLVRPVVETHPHLFSALPVFVSREHVMGMRSVIAAVESVMPLPAYRAAVLDRAPAVARFAPGPRGVFLGYDFHLADDGPRLIEINTNAGGALLNVELGRAQRACCEEVRGLMTGPLDIGSLEQRLHAMFLEEWRLARGDAQLARIAIVDQAPAQQYLFPEFLLFQRLFEAHGVQAVVADPAQLDWREGVLSHDGARVDLVYNRLTDFYFEAPEHAALREAYLSGAVVVTPHPRAHALYADKRNLALLTDEQRLRAWGVPRETIATLQSGIPATRPVDPADAERLWSERKALFFKPACGFGSRGSYRGDKLTRGAFAEILEGDYVAQALVPPSERLLKEADTPQALKVDLRNYVYAGEVQLVAARLYQGQTTNFRTPGGGFAPVFYPPG